MVSSEAGTTTGEQSENRIIHHLGSSESLITASAKHACRAAYRVSVNVWKAKPQQRTSNLIDPKYGMDAQSDHNNHFILTHMKLSDEIE